MSTSLSDRRLRLADEELYRHKRPALLVTLGLLFIATVGALQFIQPLPGFASKPFATFLSKKLPVASPSATAFGASGSVLLKFAMPGQSVEYPLDVHGDPTSLTYSWVRVGESETAEPAKPLIGAHVQAPVTPGFYRLTLVLGDKRRDVQGLTVAVLVPFKEKEGAMLNGYRIGTYLAEKISGKQEPPDGFLEVREADVN